MKPQFSKPGLLVLLSTIALTAGSLAAQETLRGPDGGTATRVSGVEVLNIAGKPFSANTSTEWTRTLEDGGAVTLHLTARLARDSQGRVFRERRTFVPAGSDKEPVLNEIHIYDPVSRSQTLCNVHQRQCTIENYTPRVYFGAHREGVFDGGNRTLTREQLGSNTIENFPVMGTRETTTVRPGVQGNDHEIVSTREFWYSEDLKTNLAVTRVDPRAGKEVIQLSRITAGEPDASLFTPPAGFVIHDLRSAASSAPPVER